MWCVGSGFLHFPSASSPVHMAPLNQQHSVVVTGTAAFYKWSQRRAVALENLASYLYFIPSAGIRAPTHESLACTSYTMQANSEAITHSQIA